MAQFLIVFGLIKVMLIKPAAFWSYAHRDDDYHDGAITMLCEKLSKAIAVAGRDDFSIFQDRKDISWGKHWPSELEEGLIGSQFLIAIVSPSFFKSDYCRNELDEFLAIEQAAGRQDLILPIYYVKTSLLEVPATRDKDPLAKAIADRQYRDWRELRHLPLSDFKARCALDSLAEELVQALEHSESIATKAEVQESDFSMPFAEPADIYEPGAQEPPAEYRSRGLMDEPEQSRLHNLSESQPDFVVSSFSGLPDPGTVFRDVDEPWCPEMVVVPPGSFIMGSSFDEVGHVENEEPQHRVRIARSFALGVFPITFDEFDHFCIETARRKPEDEGWGRGRRPVINVNIDDAEAYLAWLSEITAKSYGLPSEEMWEYACRAGTEKPFSTGKSIDNEEAKLVSSSDLLLDDIDPGKKALTIAVGNFSANPFGLFDMHGNIGEWCADHYRDGYNKGLRDGSAWLKGDNPDVRVARGIDHDGCMPRSARRFGQLWCTRGKTIGFRCARFED